VPGSSQPRRCPSCAEPLPPAARFCPSCGARHDDPREPPRDEVRPVTVLFADIVGSTRLGEQLPPDEVKALVGECVTRMGAAVEAHGGVVQAYMGDGICAYFGVPRAREDDAHRAARAALDILDVVSSYRQVAAATWPVEDLDVRVGINSGRAAVGVVGAAVPSVVALGDATNLAARLEATATPGSVLVGAATSAQLLDFFELEPVGRITAKGREEPVEAFRLVGTRAEPRRRETALVGRVDELGGLREIAAELRRGRGGVVFVTGDAGIGKSRLLAEFSRLVGDDATILIGRCVSYGSVPLSPFAAMLRDWLGVDGSDPAERLTSLLGAGAAPLLRLLGLHSRRGDSTAGRAAELIDAFHGWLRALISRRPLVLALEDIQWLDGASRVLAESILPLTDVEPLVVVGTLRHVEGSPGARLQSHPSHAQVLELAPLSPAESERLVEAVAPDIDSVSRRDLVEQAQGNPLYVEELAKAFSDLGGPQRRRTWTITVGAPGPLPPSLESLLVARVDLLPNSARRLAQAAAVVGRTVPAPILERLGEAGDLALLLDAEILEGGDGEYTFSSGLLHDAVLAELPAKHRKALYLDVAASYEELFPAELERLGHYYAQADQPLKALPFLEAAAHRADELGAPAAALDLYERARRTAVATGDDEAAARISRDAARLEM
jgi:class 3 adenylate cyclase